MTYTERGSSENSSIRQKVKIKERLAGLYKAVDAFKKLKIDDSHGICLRLSSSECLVARLN